MGPPLTQGLSQNQDKRGANWAIPEPKPGRTQVPNELSDVQMFRFFRGKILIFFLREKSATIFYRSDMNPLPLSEFLRKFIQFWGDGRP